VANSKEIRKRFEILKKINALFREYNNLEGVRRISTTDFESHYGEYLVASKLLDERFTVQISNKKGYDLMVASHRDGCTQRIEVKTSRLQRRIREGKHDAWGWVVKKSQWDPQGFNFLVCIACEWQPKIDGILAFSYPEVKSFFAKGDLKYQKFEREVKDYLRLSLYKKGLSALNEDLPILRKEIKLTGEPTKFEIELNKNPTLAFKKYSWDRFVSLLKKQHHSNSLQ